MSEKVTATPAMVADIIMDVVANVATEAGVTIKVLEVPTNGGGKLVGLLLPDGFVFRDGGIVWEGGNE